MNELEKAIVEGFIRDNPIKVHMSEGTPIAECNLREIYDAVCCLNGRDAWWQFEFFGDAIAWNHGCEFDKYGPRFFTIVRHPRDLRLGITVNVEKIFQSLDGAQRDMYECFAGQIARCVLNDLQNLDENGLLFPAIAELGGVNDIIILGD